MAGINNLADVYKKKGDSFIDDLLNLKVKITEKISGNKFSFEFNKGVFTFYKRQTDYPINKIDRSLVRLYEEPIQYFESLPEKIKLQIPVKWRFSFEYFNNNSPLSFITYQNLPKNKLVLTHILKPNGSIIEDKAVLEKWAELFNTSGPPIIFEGYLSFDQKDAIREYIRTPAEENIERHQTESFSKFIITLLNKEVDTSFLNNDLDSSIEGVVFSFENGDKQIYAKLIDPIIEKVIENNKKKEEKNDILPIIYSDMIEFMEKRQFWKKVKLKKTEIDERYLELICKIFNKFIEENKGHYDNIDIKVPSFLKQEDFDINLRFIDNEKTIGYINETKKNKELFKILLALFKKKKKNISEFLVPSVLKYQNNIVDEIFAKISEDNFEKKEEIPTLEEFINYFLDKDSGIDKVYEELPDIKVKEDMEKSITENKVMRLISFWQGVYKNENNSDTFDLENKKKIIVVAGDFYPFHNGYIDFCRNFSEENKLKVVWLHIGKNDEVVKILSDKIKENEKWLFDFMMIKSDRLNEVLKGIILPRYNPVFLIVDEKNKNYYQKQLDFFGRENGNFLETTILEFPKYTIEERNITTDFLKELIENDDYLEFKKYVPDYIKDLFEVLKKN